MCLIFDNKNNRTIIFNEHRQFDKTNYFSANSLLSQFKLIVNGKLLNRKQFAIQNKLSVLRQVIIDPKFYYLIYNSSKFFITINSHVIELLINCLLNDIDITKFDYSNNSYCDSKNRIVIVDIDRKISYDNNVFYVLFNKDACKKVNIFKRRNKIKFDIFSYILNYTLDKLHNEIIGEQEC